ncbi:hypothetical protein QO010_001848 [Caulobacter ginsengisoli]|uniref:DUF1905 domain-containing protein n=1 Tax=Caulobacter ginsengisoli TaxID=400775 RepID=A0ABU0IPZ1_9CAUL|nr:YdeI/OmpD-associated family protein [Caulobacter ginsengisoli]MDQ0464077.1 hypothetical protein [Caulobacter ginsengisoli]
MQGCSGEVTVERHAPQLPRFAVLPFDPLAMWGFSELFTADGTLGGAPFTRRSVKPWGDGRWWIDLPNALCAAAGVDTGDRVVLTLVPDGNAPAVEIAALLETDAALMAAWNSYPPSHQREWSRWVEEAKKPETRAARAAKVAERLR